MKLIPVLAISLLIIIFKISSVFAVTILNCEGKGFEYFDEDLRFSIPKKVMDKRKSKANFKVIFDDQHIKLISDTLNDRNIKLFNKSDSYMNYSYNADYLSFNYRNTIDDTSIANVPSYLDEFLYIDRFNGNFKYEEIYSLKEEDKKRSIFYWEKKFGKGTDKYLEINGKCKKIDRAF